MRKIRKIKTFRVRSVIALNKRGYSNKQISNMVGVPVRNIINMLYHRGLLSNRYVKVTETPVLEEFIVGTTLGDSYISKVKPEKGDKNSSYSVGHSSKQLEYLEWKASFLKNMGFDAKVRFYRQKHNRYSKGFCDTYSFRSSTHPIFTKYRNKFYVDNIKIIPRDIVLTPFTLALIYMDDGSKGTSGYNIAFHGFTLGDREFFSDILKRDLDIESTCHKGGNIYIPKREKEKFTKIVFPYIINCMKYKLH